MNDLLSMSHSQGPGRPGSIQSEAIMAMQGIKHLDFNIHLLFQNRKVKKEEKFLVFNSHSFTLFYGTGFYPHIHTEVYWKRVIETPFHIDTSMVTSDQFNDPQN